MIFPGVAFNKIIPALIFIFVCSAASADACKDIIPIEPGPYKNMVDNRELVYVALDYKTGQCSTINFRIKGNGLYERRAPYSTFKIPHTLIALETGAVKDIDLRTEWNAIKRPAKSFWPETWKKPHSLTTAFKHSAVWYYQDLVSHVDPVDYKKWLKTFQYGNQTFTPGTDQFWLDGELKISPYEQLEFIDCLLKNQCKVSDKNFSAFESIALLERSGEYSLFAKTGTGPKDPKNNDGAFEGWFVGYVKDGKANPVAAFVLYVGAENFSDIKDFRKQISLTLLQDQNLWPGKHVR